jgi:4-hydroxyphenylpyruvate dioxygenase
MGRRLFNLKNKNGPSSKMEKIDYLEIYVSDLSASLNFYVKQFQFYVIACSTLQDRLSVLIRQGEIYLVLTCPQKKPSDVGRFIHLHGDGVKDIAFLTNNVEAQFELALQNGHQPIQKPTIYTKNNEIIYKATVSAFGEITHTFIQRSSKTSHTLPFFEYIKTPKVQTTLFHEIDHIAVCINQGDLSVWVNNYINTYAYSQVHEEYVVTANSGMNSKVIQSTNGQVKIVFVEPINGIKQSQVTEFLNNFNGPGVQHIAFSTKDIISSVKSLRESGLKMLSIPAHYYEIKKKQLSIDENTLKKFQAYSILLDEYEQGFLYQIFSKPINQLPTLFFEIIQRVQYDGFGSDNIKTLFQAIEQEQMNRATASI